MRVTSSLPYSGLGLTLFAALGAVAPAQQAQRLDKLDTQEKQRVQLAPTRLEIRPTQVLWEELVHAQATLPRRIAPAEQPGALEGAQPASSEPIEDIVLESPNAQPRPGRTQPTTPEGGIQQIAPCVGFPVLPAPGVSTIGQPDGPDSFATLYYPPNAAGGVGREHLMVMAPNFTLIQDRLGATVSSIDTITFWSPTGATSVNWCRLDYDGVNGRWHATARGGVGVGATSVLFAISDTDDPTGGWDFYTIPADPAFLTYADNLKKGYNQTWVVVTAEMYSSTAAAGSQGSRVYTFDVAGALAGGPVVANIFPSNYVTLVTGQGNAAVNWRNIPTRSLDGSLGDIHLLNIRLATAASPIMQMVKITGTGVAPTIVPGIVDSGFGPDPDTSSLFFIPFDYTNVRQAVFQVGDARFIDPIPSDGTLASTRARFADAVVRNGKLWIVQNHGLPAPAGAAATQNGLGFYELDPNGAISQITFVGPFNQQVQVTDGVNTTCFYPSIAVNCAEDVLIGFSRSDLTKNIEAAYCIRLGTDPLGTMGPTTTLKAGESSWWQVGPPPATTLGAWGFYTSTSIDPNDDATMWTLQPYAATRVGGADADSRWGTWWGRFGDCEVLPVITDQPDSYSGCIGDMVSMSVSATTSSLPLSYQWRHNGVDLLGETNDTLTIASTVASDEGTYDCVVCACGTVISAPATIDFNEPTITTQPVDFFAKLHEPAGFFVVATPFLGSLSYQWFHENTPVGTNSDLFLIGSVTPADYGDYHVEVTDACGVATSNTFRLVPPGKTKNVSEGELNVLQIFDQPDSQNACIGSPAVISVTAYPNDVTYVWRKNLVPIAPPETNSTLVFPSVMLADTAIYDVVVTDGPNSKTSVPAALNAIDVPVISVQPAPANQTVPPGTDVLYFVTVIAGGNVTFQWEKRPTTPFAPFVPMPGQTNNSLGLDDVTSSDAGTYRCRIDNECGFVRTTTCRLIVL